MTNKGTLYGGVRYNPEKKMGEPYACTPFPTKPPPCCIVAGVTVPSQNEHGNEQKPASHLLSDSDKQNILDYLHAQINHNSIPSPVTELVYPEGFSELDDSEKQKHFKKKYIKKTENSIPLAIPYSQDILDRKGLHIGQRKLLLAEVQFLVKLLMAGKTEHVNYVVYVGAAPNWKMMMLSDLFPNTHFLLFDPTPFKIGVDYKDKGASNQKDHRSEKHPKIVHVYTSPLGYKGYTSPHMHNGERKHKKLSDMDYQERNELFGYITKKNQPAKIFIFEHIFDERDARAVCEGFRTNGKKYCFVSDIRIVSSRKKNAKPSPGDVLLSHAQHWVWLRILLCPFTIKFRVPFNLKEAASEAKRNIKNNIGRQKVIYNLAKKLDKGIVGIDFIKNAGSGHIMAPVGDLYVQAYAKRSSTEGRLVGLQVQQAWKVDTTDLESRYFGFNAITRCFTLRQSPDNISVQQYFSNDYALEQHIWGNYIEATRSSRSYDTQLLTELASKATRWGNGTRKYVKKTETEKEIKGLIGKIKQNDVVRKGFTKGNTRYRA